MWKIIDFLNRKSKPLLVVLGFILVILLAVLDYFTSANLFFAMSYLLPVFLIAWFLGRWAGIIISIISAILVSIVSTIAWLMTDVASGTSAASNVVPAWGLTAKLGFFLAFTYILAALKSALEYERELARTDYLTTIANRRYFFELASLEVNRSIRHNHPFTAAYMDIDDFKKVNDTYGHNKGDEILKLVSKITKNSLRTYDMIARVGGDEFTVLLPETDYEASKTVMGRVAKNLNAAVAEKKLKITFSIGVITFRNFKGNVDEMVNKVDASMYEVKKSGKNNIKYELLDFPAGDAKSAQNLS